MYHFTFEGLGFGGIQPIFEPTIDEETGMYRTVDIECKRGFESVILELMAILKKYIANQSLLHKEIGYLAAVAYMADGSVATAFNDSNPSGLFVKGRGYGADYHKGDECKGNYKSTMEYVNAMILSKYPQGLFLLQEVPCEEGGKKHFRVVHSHTWDMQTTSSNELKHRQQKKKNELIFACVEYLATFNGKYPFTDGEINELTAVLDLLSVLDPHRKMAKDERLQGIGRTLKEEDGTEKPGKIIQFKKRELPR